MKSTLTLAVLLLATLLVVGVDSLALHRATGEPSYLQFVTRTRALPEWDLGIVIGRRPGIGGHSYAYMACCLAQLELHRLQPSSRLLGPRAFCLDPAQHPALA